MCECFLKKGKCYCPTCEPAVELFYDKKIEGYFCEVCLITFQCSEVSEQEKTFKVAPPRL